MADAGSILHSINKRSFGALSGVARCVKPLTDGPFGRALEHGEPLGCLGIGYLGRAIVEDIKKHLNRNAFRRDAEVQVHRRGWKLRCYRQAWNFKVDQAGFACRCRRKLSVEREGDDQQHMGISIAECGSVMAEHPSGMTTAVVSRRICRSSIFKEPMPGGAILAGSAGRPPTSPACSAPATGRPPAVGPNPCRSRRP